MYPGSNKGLHYVGFDNSWSLKLHNFLHLSWKVWKEEIYGDVSELFYEIFENISIFNFFMQSVSYFYILLFISMNHFWRLERKPEPLKSSFKMLLNCCLNLSCKCYLHSWLFYNMVKHCVLSYARSEFLKIIPAIQEDKLNYSMFPS